MPRAKTTPVKNASTRKYTRRASTSRVGYTYRSSPYRRYSSSYSRKPTFTLPQFAVAQMDPFDPAARGVRVPDESTAPSSAFKLFDQVGVSGSTGGTPVANEMACRLFFPNVQRYSITQSNTSNATNSVAWATAWNLNSATPSKRDAVTSNYSVSRPVAHAVRLACPLAPTTVTGFCHIALISIDTFGAAGDDPQALATAGKLPTTVADMRELPHYRRVTLASLTQEPMTVVNKFLDTTAFRYTSTESDELTSNANGQDKGTFHVPNSWMAIVVLVEGHGQAAGSTVLTCENICHFEGQTKTAGLNTDDTAETANPDAFDGTASAAGKSKASWFSSEQPMIAAAFYNAMLGWVNQFGRAAARSAGSWAPRLAASYVYNRYRPGMPGVNNANRLTNA